MFMTVTGMKPHGAVSAAYLTSSRRGHKGLSTAPATVLGWEPGKVAVNYVDKFLSGLLQYVNVPSQTICSHLPLFSPAGLIKKTIVTKSARFIQIARQGIGVGAGGPLGEEFTF